MTETAKPPSGRTILKAIREELLINLYPLPFSTLPVTIYHVYLCPRDYAVVEGVVPRIVEQIERALTADVQRFNAKLDRSRARVLTRLLERDEPLAPIEVPASGWEVHIQPDPDGELKPGQLGIVSTLSIANAAEYGGTPTTKIVKSVVTGGRRTATSSVVHQTGRGTTPSEPLPESNERARLTYEDDQGRHVFSMRKDALSVGRGGSAAWVDVQVITTAKVSREHFRIRRDPSGRFFIQDVSSWGTSVNGAQVPPAIKSAEGVLQPGPEQELPASARIALADAMDMQFEAAMRR
jgi:FHA domain